MIHEVLLYGQRDAYHELINPVGQQLSTGWPENSLYRPSVQAFSVGLDRVVVVPSPAFGQTSCFQNRPIN